MHNIVDFRLSIFHGKRLIIIHFIDKKAKASEVIAFEAKLSPLNDESKREGFSPTSAKQKIFYYI